ncbi:hypothetical protein [Crenothrix sp.]|uniref:hypothetical protein n=1 Tax=Crenothrix sp. TaxID=3100433 RepID=UPI00374CD4B8
MKHKTTANFWDCYDNLPSEVQNVADKNFVLLKLNPQHPSLHFKKVGKVWSVRIGLNYRAVAVPFEDYFLWTWIGTHDEYIKLIASN